MEVLGKKIQQENEIKWFINKYIQMFSDDTILHIEIAKEIGKKHF